MRIRTLSSLLIALVSLFSATSLILSLLSTLAVEQRYAALTNRLQLQAAANLLARGSDYLTENVRAYAATGDERYKAAFYNEVNIGRMRERGADQIRELGALDAEIALIEQAKRDSDALIALEDKAFEAAGKERFREAIDTVYGIEYRIAKDRIMGSIAEANQLIEARLKQKEAGLDRRSRILVHAANASLFLTVLTILAALILFFRRQVVSPISRLTEQTQAMLAGDHAMQFSYQDSRNEIGELARSLESYR